MKRSRVAVIILAVFFSLMFGYFYFVSSIIDLANSKDRHEVTIDYAYQILEIENSINGIIPIGKEYYYVGFSEDDGNAYLIRAGKKWLDANFDAEGVALASDGYYIKALAKKAGDYEVENELEDRMSQLEGISSPLPKGYILELNYVRKAIVKIVVGMISFAMVIFMVIFRKTNLDNLPRPLKALFLIVIFAVLALNLVTLF